MDIFLIVIGIIVLLIGIAGSVLPVIPGPTVSFVSLILLQFTSQPPFTLQFLVIMGFIMALVTVLDYVVPVIGTKKFGGSKMGVRGSTVGLIFGVIILPFMGITLGPFGLLGLILGPFFGAYIGESMSGKDSRLATRAAIGSFLGFISGIVMKLAYAAVVSWYFFTNAF